MARDFRNKTFQKVLRGYAPEEVEEYIAYLNEEYRKMERRAAESERKFALAQKKLDEAMKKDGVVDSVGPAAREAAAKLLREAEGKAKERADGIAKEAEDRAAETVQAAVREAEEILNAAKTEAETHKNDAKRIYDTAQSLFGEIGVFREKLFALYNEHLDKVDVITETAQEFMDGIDGKYPEGAAAVTEEDELPEEETEEPVEIENTEDEEETEEIESDEEESTAEDEEYDDEVDDEVYDEVVADEEEAEEESMNEQVAENLTFMDRLFASQLRSEDEEPEKEDLYIDPVEEESEEPIITIDWKNRSAVEYSEANEEEPAAVDESADFRVLDGFDEGEEIPIEEETEENYDDYGNEYVEDSEEATEEEKAEDDGEDEEEDEYSGMDAIFNEDKSKREMSLTDEFNIIFADDKSQDNVQEISRQPTVTPEAPKKGKKHKGF